MITLNKKYVLMKDIEEKANAYIGHMALACEYDQSDAVAAFMSHLKDIPEQAVVSKDEYDNLYKKYMTLLRLLNGEWVNCDDVEAAMNITFREGLKRFDFGRDGRWNKPPLNGQYTVAKFRMCEKTLKPQPAVFWCEEDEIDYAKANAQANPTTHEWELHLSEE